MIFFLRHMRPFMSNVRVGLVGIGAQSQENLLPSLLQTPDIHVVAVCDGVAERARLVHRHVKDVELYDDVAKMLTDTKLDALVVACPPQAHRDIATLAMNRGVHVFVEKPPCFTLNELLSLTELSRQSGLVTGVGMNFRFARSIQHLRLIQNEPQFGRTAHIQLNHYANKPRAPMWGLDSTLRSFLLAQAIHTIDLAMLFGGDVKETRSEVQNDNGSLIVEINISFKNGATASILTGTMFPYFEFEMKLISDTSTMVRLDNLSDITLHEPDHVTRAGGNDKRWRGYWRPGPLDSGYVRSGYQSELQDFFDAIRTGGKFEADFANLIPTYEVIEQVCEKGDRLAAEVAIDTLNLLQGHKPSLQASDLGQGKVSANV
ncbi:Gfo/Idh/MocA family protein [Dyella psychrodurans]|nr:Gfo/Idh/MocA family oxidoreductase [Dyella psychrodurans]